MVFGVLHGQCAWNIQACHDSTVHGRWWNSSKSNNFGAVFVVVVVVVVAAVAVAVAVAAAAVVAGAGAVLVGCDDVARCTNGTLSHCNFEVVLTELFRRPSSNQP